MRHISEWETCVVGPKLMWCILATKPADKLTPADLPNKLCNFTAHVARPNGLGWVSYIYIYIWYIYISCIYCIYRLYMDLILKHWREIQWNTMTKLIMLARLYIQPWIPKFLLSSFTFKVNTSLSQLWQVHCAVNFQGLLKWCYNGVALYVRV